jgi:hypothetical protein
VEVGVEVVVEVVVVVVVVVEVVVEVVVVVVMVVVVVSRSSGSRGDSDVRVSLFAMILKCLFHEATV